MEVNTEMNSVHNKLSQSRSGTMINHDAFLRLLISQMKYQDPTEPMKPSEQVAQLAVLSQMEQSVKMNSTLQELLNSNNLAQAASYIGKDITSSDGVVKGTIDAVQVSSKGLIAITADNKEIPINTGIILSNSKS
ncbi:MAG: flagellar biosynthesis protein FlgD [Candidatus Liberibacter europaeus]|uniref:Basal-body rod modification protein FlgD n=1 Tax=Candidatus Liberibacter europaeus TaxID=744859 RepID=A0A2T4VXZ6_9HYPH|nr:flagellar biosynthesis protein FlgD [Candidatus Liberibacter europaeus]PTL86640.1 MAG: flagellar biosynthesis protein FlgD [Candidatus Liberibacter europaeus]